MKSLLPALLLISAPLGAQDWKLTIKSPQFREYEDVQVRLLQDKDLLSRYPQVAEYQTKRVFPDGRYAITVKYLRSMGGTWQWAIKSRTEHLADGTVSAQSLTEDSQLAWVKLEPPFSPLEKARLGRVIWLFSLK